MLSFDIKYSQLMKFQGFLCQRLQDKGYVIDDLQYYYEFEPGGDDVVFDFYMKDGGFLQIKANLTKKITTATDIGLLENK
jgi:hypothetical protein